MASEDFVKIAFKLEQDKDGYPPDEYETLWAVSLEDGLYRLDNIPLFVKGISSEDIIVAEQQEGRLQFVRLVRSSTNSVFRLYVADQATVQSARDSFRALGCESEGSYIPKLFALEIPGSTDIRPVEALIEQGVEEGRWEYEQGVLRHSPTTTTS